MWSCPCSSADALCGGPLEGLVKKVVKKMGRGRFTEEEIASVWASSVGKKAAAHTRPVSFKKSVLLVNVDGSAWLYELTTKKKEILKKLAGYDLAGKKIKEVRFRIGEVR